MGLYLPTDAIAHYGVGHLNGGHSGRYPFGSGENPYQHNASFLKTYHDYKNSGMSEKEIAKNMGCKNTSELRAQISAASNYNRRQNIEQARSLYETGKGIAEIARTMGEAEGTVRYWVKSDKALKKSSELDSTADALKNRLKEVDYLDVSSGIELQLGITKDRLTKTVAQLEQDGYVTMEMYVPQVGTGHRTTMKVLAPPGTEWVDVKNHMDRIKPFIERDRDPDMPEITNLGMEKPVTIDSKRVYIRYAEDGGIDKDGVIELRRGVPDLSLGQSSYAQGRISVDGTHYLKGMCITSDRVPDGYDIVFNTNKKRGTAPGDVFKKLSDDPDNPFGSTIKAQNHYIDANGKEQLSAVNIVREEGDWATWNKTLASQVLSKQPIQLAKKQLTLSYDEKRAELDDILNISNPTVRREQLKAFADDCDSSAVHLKAAALPRQTSKVILPLVDIKDNEIYAPQYRDGETVVLIRYPHGGRFEIPELVVNNRNAEGRAVLGDAIDAVGINSKVAERLSGADFDGDTVLVIPNNNGAVKTAPALEGLKGFNTKSYALNKSTDENGNTIWVDDMGRPRPTLTDQTKGAEMGKVTNLITDMTIKGASWGEIERATKHSMVVIDSAKHHLDYKQSEIDNGIPELKAKWQGGANRGASTLISKAKSTKYVDERKDYYKIDPETGKKIYMETGREYSIDRKVIDPETGKQAIDPETGKKIWEPTGKMQKAQQKSTKMAEVDDAYELSSGTQIEDIYASYANQLKAMANEARKASVGLKQQRNPEAAKEYAAEVETLKHKLNVAKKNSPYERQALILANTIVNSKKQANPDLTDEQIKKIRGQALASARATVGAKKAYIDITEREWKAIEKGAVSESLLQDIINNAEDGVIKQYTMPMAKTGLTGSKLSIAKSMKANGYTDAEIADRVGYSVSTVRNALNGK